MPRGQGGEALPSLPSSRRSSVRRRAMSRKSDPQTSKRNKAFQQSKATESSKQTFEDIKPSKQLALLLEEALAISDE